MSARKARQSTEAESNGDAKSAIKDGLKSSPIADVESQLGSSSAGLGETEAQRRLVQYGPNAIAAARTDSFLKFLGYF